MWRSVAEWTFPSEPDTERLIVERVIEAIKELHIAAARLERLKTATAEATMNALEHGNHFQPDVPVAVEVLASEVALAVRITDQALSRLYPSAVAPDLEAKLAGSQTPRGWGLFLIKQLVDEMHVSSSTSQHTVELVLYLTDAPADRAA